MPTSPQATPRTQMTAEASVTSPTVTSSSGSTATAGATSSAARSRPSRISRGARRIPPRSDHRVVVEVLPRGVERGQMVLERAREHGGEPLRRPAQVVMNAPHRTHVTEQHDLLASNSEYLSGDLLGLLSGQEYRYRSDVLRPHLLDLLDADLLHLGLGGDGADHAGPRERGDAVGGDVVARHVQGHHLREAHDAELGRRV